jgi:ATPase family associated with various cellular activities (AAA)/Winged helix domain, variant
MIAADTIQWIETNQQALSGELSWLRQQLEQSLSGSVAAVIEAPAETAFTLDYISAQFQLSSFERTVVLLCAGCEIDSEISQLCRRMQSNLGHNDPTFGQALTVLPDPHWSALSPVSPLRYWHLIQVAEPGQLTTARLTLDEHILHFLLGAAGLDQRMIGLVRPMSPSGPLPLSQRRQVSRLNSLWHGSNQTAVFQIQGNDPGAGRDVAASACAELELKPLMLRAADIPLAIDERILLTRLLSREYLLSRSVVLIDASDETSQQLAAFIEELVCPVMLLGECPVRLQQHSSMIEVNKPTTDEQRQLWQQNLPAGDEIAENELSQLTAQFNFSAGDITTTAEVIQTDLTLGTSLKLALWQSCRLHSRGELDHLAQRITPRVGWDDLILPGGQKAILHDISRQVRHRATVYDTWGFAGKSDRGLGISALFAGESGTGKTLAAEVLAADLKLDLYRIDLSSVVSKYIGETEKNLERLFTTAETSGAILLFDEADALFGKRSNVKDSHDRYANIELAYLLQRMEAYRGLSILTSNMKSALDTAFLRRIRFMVQFPFPDAAQRREIWKRIFPGNLPHGELQPTTLARLHLAGGNIRNIALNAAFLAADKNAPVTMTDLAQAARLECAKLEKPPTEFELRKWK